jgi:hypothetical protein
MGPSLSGTHHVVVVDVISGVNLDSPPVRLDQSFSNAREGKAVGLDKDEMMGYLPCLSNGPRHPSPATSVRLLNDQNLTPFQIPGTML